MGNNSDYLKDIEKYFLSLAGKGIMLSSMDYSLILEWRDKEIPKEIVFKGINRAFENSQRVHGKDKSSIRNLKQCVEYINNSIEEFRPIIGDKKQRAGSSESDISVSNIILKLNTSIQSAKEDIVKNYYVSMKESILKFQDTENTNFLSLCTQVEEKSLEKFFMNLPEHERDQINIEAKNILGDRARRMTPQAVYESLGSFRNEILSKKYNLKTISSLTEDTVE